MTASGTESVINKVQYVEQDFSTYVDSIREFIRVNYPKDFNDYVNSQMGMALVDIIAYASHSLAWYLNRRTTDLYFPTAISPNAVAKISRMLGYKPRGAVASVATITVTLTAGPYSFPVRITKGFQFKGPNNLLFEYRGDESITFVPGETVKSFDVREGRSITENYISTGDVNQIFTMKNVPTGMYVADNDVSVKVNSESWTEYDFIPFEISQSFETDVISTPSTVKFGDGVQGSIPATGYGIEVKYFVTNGFRGRIDSGGITKPSNTLVVNSTSIPMSVVQSNPSFGGEDPETLTEIVANAPRFQDTQDRAITKYDYDFLANSYENIARADAQIIRTVSSDYTINSLVALINNDLNQIINLVGGVSGYGIISGYTNTIRSDIGIVTGQLVSMTSHVDSTATTVTGFSTAATYVSGQTANMSSYIDGINTQMNLLVGYASGCPAVSGSILGVVNSVTGYTGSMSTSVAAINSVSGIGSMNTWYQTISGDMASVSSSISIVSGASMDIISQCSTIDVLASEVSTVFPVSGYAENVSGYTIDMYNYLDSILSDGCRANTVQVMILAKDSARKYVAPSSTTITSLQSYLDERKDAVHTVVVVPGTTRVLECDMKVEVKLTETAAEDDVLNRVRNALVKADEEPLGLLVEREFNESLYISDVYSAINAVVEDWEVDYVNVLISNPSGYFDTRGNVVIPKGYVIQTGNVTVGKLAIGV